MKTTQKTRLVPKLRFPEFREAEGWENLTLGQMGSFLRGLTYTPGDVADKGLLVLRSGNIQDGSLTFNKDLVFVEKECPPDLLLQIGDVVICMSNGSKALVGKSGEYLQGYSGKVTIGAFCSLYRPKNPFSKIAFKSEKYSDFIADSIMGGNINNLKNSTLEGFVFSVPPSLPEQQKIADCLSSLDELIAAHSRKLDALKTHKKGLMQQLFPREGETQPRLRFPEFRGAGEWSDAPMGTLLMSSPDYGVNAAAVPFSENLPKYLRITDISEDGRYLPEKQVSVDLEATDGNYLDEGDIVLARTGASVGKSYQYRKEDGRLVFAGFLIRVKPHPKNLVSTYLSNFLTSGQFWKWVAVTSARSGQPGINSTEYSSLTIPLPPSLPEQHRIATYLSSLDALIAAASQKLEALKVHKKGLMQGLFPSTESESRMDISPILHYHKLNDTHL